MQPKDQRHTYLINLTHTSLTMNAAIVFLQAHKVASNMCKIILIGVLLKLIKPPKSTHMDVWHLYSSSGRFEAKKGRPS